MVYKSEAGSYFLELAGSAGVSDSIQVGDRGDIRQTGFVPENEIVEWYNSLSGFFLPSVREGCGLPIMEAAACGTPVFVYEDVEISEEMEDLVIRVSSVEEVPGLVDKFSDEDSRDLAEKASRFSWSDTVEKHEEVYDRLQCSDSM